MVLRYDSNFTAFRSKFFSWERVECGVEVYAGRSRPVGSQNMRLYVFCMESVLMGRWNTGTSRGGLDTARSHSSSNYES